MSKAMSYYDWDLSFRRSISDDTPEEKEKVNILGISDNVFKDFLKEWKKNNL